MRWSSTIALTIGGLTVDTGELSIQCSKKDMWVVGSQLLLQSPDVMLGFYLAVRQASGKAVAEAHNPVRQKMS